MVLNVGGATINVLLKDTFKRLALSRVFKTRFICQQFRTIKTINACLKFVLFHVCDRTSFKCNAKVVLRINSNSGIMLENKNASQSVLYYVTHSLLNC